MSFHGGPLSGHTSRPMNFARPEPCPRGHFLTNANFVPTVLVKTALPGPPWWPSENEAEGENSMSRLTRIGVGSELLVTAGLYLSSGLAAAQGRLAAQPDDDAIKGAAPIIRHVFVIAMENHDSTQIYGNTTGAPYINNTL